MTMNNHITTTDVLTALAGPRWPARDPTYCGTFLGTVGRYDVWFWMDYGDNPAIWLQNEGPDCFAYPSKHLWCAYIHAHAELTWGTFEKMPFTKLPRERQVAYRFGTRRARKLGLLR